MIYVKNPRPIAHRGSLTAFAAESPDLPGFTLHFVLNAVLARGVIAMAEADAPMVIPEAALIGKIGLN